MRESQFTDPSACCSPASVPAIYGNSEPLFSEHRSQAGLSPQVGVTDLGFSGASTCFSVAIEWDDLLSSAIFGRNAGQPGMTTPYRRSPQ
jgi:hypothetical protein